MNDPAISVTFTQLIVGLLIGSITLLLFCLIFFARTGLLALLKSLTLKVGKPSMFDESKALVDYERIRSLIAAIPYQAYRTSGPALDTVWDVRPHDRYVQSIKKGFGNCSNLSFGAFYKLSPDYQVNIVHYNHAGTIFGGRSHTVLQAKVKFEDGERTVIVDLLYAGLWLDGSGDAIAADRLADYDHEVRFESCNIRKSGEMHIRFAYDSSEGLSGSVVGQVPQCEIDRYFRFIDAVYVPFGNRRLEKMAYDFLAILINRYPKTYVTSLGYKKLFQGRYHIIVAAYLTKYLVYSTVLLSAVYIAASL